jgi:hypothetical protein
VVTLSAYLCCGRLNLQQLFAPRDCTDVNADSP